MKRVVFALILAATVLGGCHDGESHFNRGQNASGGMRGGFEPRWRYDYNCTPGRRPEAPDCRYYN